ncbi:MAG: phosphatase PAP2 family protein [Bauldia sp.]
MAEVEARGVTGGWRWPLGPIRILIVATALLSVVFLLIPNLDLWFSRQFYDPEIGFPALRIPALHWLRDVSGLLLWVAGTVVGVSLLAKLFVFPRRRPLVPGRAMLFLSATLALSAGLLVNGVLKSLWGRPRPTQVLEFGGDAPFVTAWHISDFCARNCSFVSGEASAAIWLVAVALVVPARFRRAALAAALALAFAFSLNRIAFGGHFLSDVLLAWTLTLLVIAVAWHVIYVRPPRFFEEAAIDGALTRAGLWLRGLVARRKSGEPSPLHPEAAAVLAADTVAVQPGPHQALRGLRAAGHGFAGPIGPDDEPEPASDRDGGEPLWADETHRDAEPADEETPPPGPTVAAFPPPSHDEPDRDGPAEEHLRAVEAAVRDAVDDGIDPTGDADRTAVADADGPAASASPASNETVGAAENIESIDPEPEEAPPSGAPAGEGISGDAAAATAAAPLPPSPEPDSRAPAGGTDEPAAPETPAPADPPAPADDAAAAPAGEPAEPSPRPRLLELPPPDRA